MNLKRKHSALLLTPILCLAAASPAAASYTLGQLHAPYAFAQCGTGISLQTGVEPGSAAYWMPAGIGDGVITGWQTATAANAGSAKLEVLRPTGVAGQYTVLATDGSYPVFANTFPTFSGLRIPIREGDSIALDSAGTNCFSQFASVAYTYSGFGSGIDPGAGGTITQMATGTNFALELSATVETDIDGDGYGYGDDSQDQCPENAAAHVVPCVAPPAAEAGTAGGATDSAAGAAPRITLRGRPFQAALKQGAVIEIAEADQAVSLRATGSLRIAGRKLPLTATAAAGAAGARTRLSLAIPKAVKRQVLRAIVRGTKVRAVLNVSATSTSTGSSLATQSIAIGPAAHKHR